MTGRNDPFRKLYDKIERREFFVSIIFCITTGLSFLTTLQDEFPKNSSFNYGNWIQVAIVLVSLLGFLLSLSIREYSFPNAEDKRIKDNLTNAFCISFGQEKTNGYYNNEFQNPDLKNAANTLENIFFTKEILSAIFARKTAFMLFCILVSSFLFFIADIKLSSTHPNGFQCLCMLESQLIHQAFCINLKL